MCSARRLCWRRKRARFLSGPVFRYFEVFEQIGEAGFFDATAQVRAWRHAFAQRPSAQQAVSPQYPALLRQFLRERNAELSRRRLSRG